MGFRFIHTADWQLAKPFTRFGVELNAKLQDARLQAIDRIAEVARREGAGHVFVAGDVWDQRTPTDAALIKPLDKMAKADGLQWWLLPGNHDPAEPQGLWDRLASLGLPANVHPLTTSEPVIVEEGVALLPAPWTSKRPGLDLTATFDRMATLPGAVRIGLGHGGVQGFGSEAEEAVTVDPNRADRAHLRYLALGDWHGARQAGPRAWYSGTPEPDGFRSTEQGHVLVVDTDEPDAPVLQRTAAFDWVQAELTCDPTTEFDTALREFVPEREDLSQRLLRLTLTGTAGFGQRQSLEALWQRSEPRFASAELRADELHVLSEGEDLDTALGQGSLREVAQRLAKHEETSIGSEALLLLLGFAQQVQR